MDLVERRAMVVNTDDCWVYAGAIYPNGYGRVDVNVGGCSTSRRAHRIMYESIVGEIPEGLVMDHLCRVRLCINPDHLEPVTHAENSRRGIPGVNHNSLKTFCAQGHEFDQENTYRHGGKRLCRKCRAAFAKKRNDALRIAYRVH